ncbi:hypothetical protein V8G56_01355 [Gaetbulibacter aquiaggeris]|uniref:Uncharacterized protein n=1 Tax=Gaetbulibacter aquiaggeris TaxID=1735373 RepID=A0ABW7MKL8_9FLAO
MAFKSNALTKLWYVKEYKECVLKKLENASIKKYNPKKTFDQVKIFKINWRFFNVIFGIIVNAKGTKKRHTVLSNPVLVKPLSTVQNHVKENSRYKAIGNSRAKFSVPLSQFIILCLTENIINSPNAILLGAYPTKSIDNTRAIK